MLRSIRNFLQRAVRAFTAPTFEDKETASAVACILLVYALAIVLILTWGPQP
jgi:hypothetical protein